MLSLDDDDYETLGFGVRDEFSEQWRRENAEASREVASKTRNRRSDKSPAGRWLSAMRSRKHYAKVKAAREPRVERFVDPEPHRRAALKWSRNNPEAIKKNNAKFRAANPDYQRQYRARKKAERERVREESVR